MTRVRVAAIALNQTPLDWDGNRNNLLQGLKDAREAGASLVCFPELCITGYGCEDAFLWPSVAERALCELERLAQETRGLIVAVGLPVWVDALLYNGAALLVDGNIVGIALKQHLAGEGVHYEPRWFHPWVSGTASEISVSGGKVPVGDLMFQIGKVRLGFEICEDAWVKERPLKRFSAFGVGLVLNPSASHFSFKKHAIRRQIVDFGAREFGVGYLYANLLGNEAGRMIYDGDALICRPTEGGAQVLAETRRLSFAPRSLCAATLDIRGAQAQSSSGTSRLVSRDFAFQEQVRDDVVSSRTPGADERGELGKEEALGRVLALGLFDYMRKSRAKGFVVSLSGGADSSAVVTLIWLMMRLGTGELGTAQFLERCGLSGLLRPEASEPEIMQRLLTTAYQSTENSGEVTQAAARAVATSVGAHHVELSVAELVQSYTSLAEGALGRHLTWETDDIALQNIQARVRAPTVWLLANVSGALLLSTSNRSEAAVGYATMDGDTAGGLCPLGGVDKAFLRVWLRHMETLGLPETGPLLALSYVNRQAPTAELRPPGAGQTDEADLMPYEVLDLIERLAIVQRRSEREVFTLLKGEFPGYLPSDLLRWVRRFYRLFAVNQWKRERYAPSFHVDDANLDPKTWCRFPILSGGFERELRELSEDGGSS